MNVFLIMLTIGFILLSANFLKDKDGFKGCICFTCAIIIASMIYFNPLLQKRANEVKKDYEIHFNLCLEKYSKLQCKEFFRHGNIDLYKDLETDIHKIDK